MKKSRIVTIYILLIAVGQAQAIFRVNGYRYNPYTDFGKKSGDIVKVPSIEGKSVTIIDVHYNNAHNPEDNSLIVIGAFYDTQKERYRPVILKYDFTGTLQITLVPVEAFDQDVFIDLGARTLWQDDYLYIPMYGVSEQNDWGNMLIYKYDYNIDLDNNWPNGGIFSAGELVPHRHYQAHCITFQNDKIYVGGMLTNTTQQTSKYFIMETDTILSRLHIGIDEGDVTEAMTGIQIFPRDNGLYAIFTNRSGQGRSAELVANGMIFTLEEVDAINKENFPFHALRRWEESSFFVTSNNRLLYWTMDQNGHIEKSNNEGVFNIGLIPGNPTADAFNFNSITESLDQIIISGSYTKNSDYRYPIVVTFNIEDFANIHPEPTFFKKGIWTYSKPDLHLGFNILSPVTVTQHAPSPFSFIVGRESQLFHIYPGFFDKDTTVLGRVRDRSNRGDYVPWVSQ